MTGTTHHRGTLAWLALAVLAGGAALEAVPLRPEAIEGWARYLAAVDARRAREAGDPSRFLVLDFQLDAAAERRAAVAGDLVVRRTEATDVDGTPVEVPSAMVHHWRGVVFLRGATVPRLMARLENEAPFTGPDVLAARVLARGPDTMTLFLRLQRTRFVTVVYDTEHDIRFAHESPTRASSVSTAVRIAEVADAGRASERELRPGEDRGFLWRLRVYWRYETVPGGVLAECESLSLSRPMPFGLQTIAGPLVASTARESVERTLEEVRRSAEPRNGP
jgi:hypothetical protein